MKYYLPTACLLLLFTAFSACTRESASSYTPTGDLTPTFISDSAPGQAQPPASSERGAPPPTAEEVLMADGYAPDAPGTGKLPKCYNFTPRVGKLDNYLTVSVGGGTDVALKLVSTRTQKAIRYIFINQNESYTIRNIPQGHYYTKIAYGHDWYSKSENGKCKGKFARDAHYESGEEMNFNVEDAYNGYTVPSYTLQLDMVSSSPVNTFDSQSISEDEFNN